MKHWICALLAKTLAYGLPALLAGCAASAKFNTPPLAQPALQEHRGLLLGDMVPPQSLPSRGEELWIIERPGGGGVNAAPSGEVPGAIASSKDLAPGSGMLLDARGASLLPLLLEQTTARAEVTGAIASVSVHQRFSNPSRQPANVIYAFPVPENGAVDEFVMSIGRRHIRAIVRERAEAEQVFLEAREQGLLASLMVQQAPGVFVQRVANLEPGQAIDIDVHYFHAVAYQDGWFEYIFPMIAGPRGEGWPKTSQRGGRNISISVRLNPGMKIERVESATQHVSVHFTGKDVADVSLEPADRIANADFIIRYQLATGTALESSVMTERDGDSGTFSLLMVPPANIANQPRRALEVIFALDPSAGSAGTAVISKSLEYLTDADTAQVIHGAPGAATAMADRPVPASKVAIRQLQDALSTLSANDASAESILRAALSQPHEHSRLRIVCLIIDGRDSSSDLMEVIATELREARVVAIAVGSSPRRESVDAIARRGRGAAVYLGPGADTAASLSKIFTRFSHAAATDVEIDWNGTQVSDVYPRPLPDLLPGNAVMLTGRYRSAAPTSIILHGKTANDVGAWTVRLPPALASEGHRPLSCIWARRKTQDLAEEALYRPNHAIQTQVRELALQYGLVSRYTAFIAVDAVREGTQ